MWGFEPQNVDLYLADNADFMQSVKVTDPETGDPMILGEGTEVFFRVGDERWDGVITGDTVDFKVEYEATDEVRRNTKVQFCISVGTDDWVLTQGVVVRD